MGLTTKSPASNPGSSSRLLRLLIVEDTPPDAELAVATLKRAGYSLSYEVVDSPEEFLERLKQTDYDIILSDHNLKTWTGIDALQILKRSAKDVPLVVVTATLGDEAAVDYVKRGAADYVLKHRLDRLPVAVRRALQEKTYREETARLQEVILAGKREWELTFDTVPHPVLLLDEEFRIQRANRAAVEVFGMDFSQLIGQPFHEVLHGDGPASPDVQHEFLLSNGQSERKDLEVPRLGKIFDMTSTPLRDPSGVRRGSVVVLRDITDRKRAEAEIHKLNEDLEQRVRERTAELEAKNAERMRAEEERDRFFTLSLDMLCIAGFDGYFKRLNPAWEKTLGYNREELLARPYLDFVHPDDRAATLAEAEKLTTGADTIAFENRYLCKDGSHKWLQWNATPFASQQLIYAVARDITERKQAEQAMLRAKEEAERATKFKDQFLSTMSHELRTPLNAVLGFSELLADDVYGPLNDHQRRYLEHIRNGGQHLVRLINDVLDLSRIEAGRMELALESLAVQPIVADVFESIRALADQKSLSVSHEIEPGLSVRADPTRFRQVLLNLLGNAIKFTPEGGRVELLARLQDGAVRVAVRDSGPGIPPEEQKRIFEAFYRIRRSGMAPEGTGLGLAITQRLVEMQGGQLGLESELGKGSCFYFDLPVADSVRAPVAPERKRPEPEGEPPLVLVVEDDPVSVHLLQTQLSSVGYRVVSCEESERAFDLAVELQPAAVTLDILMKPVTGWEVLARLRGDSRTRNIPVIVVSVVDRPGAGLVLGAEEYLVKPVVKKTLLAAIERCFDRRGSSLPVRPILVVDDDPDTRDLIAEILNSHGFAVATAEDGFQARDVVASTLPELVLLDLVMPGLSGFELLAEWRSNPRTADMPVFVLSGKELTDQEVAYLKQHSELLLRKQDAWQSRLVEQLRRALGIVHGGTA